MNRSAMLIKWENNNIRTKYLYKLNDQFERTSIVWALGLEKKVVKLYTIERLEEYFFFTWCFGQNVLLVYEIIVDLESKSKRLRSGFYSLCYFMWFILKTTSPWFSIDDYIDPAFRVILIGTRYHALSLKLSMKKLSHHCIGRWLDLRRE